MELIADRITKQYKNKIAVDRMSFTLTKGVTGLLGANGAGKTTLMRLLCGVLAPDSGTVSCDGMSVGTEEYRDILGYLPQDFLSGILRKGFPALYVRCKGPDKKRRHSKNKGTDRTGRAGRFRREKGAYVFRWDEAEAWDCTGSLK